MVVAALMLLMTAPDLEQIRVEGLAERPPDRISIFTVRDKGIRTPLILFQEKARREVEAHLHARIVSMEEMFARGAITYRSMVECRGDAECFAARLAGVDARYLLLITAAQIGDTRLTGARLIDLEKRRIVGESIEEVSGRFEDAVPARIKAAVPEAWWDPFGSLRLTATPAGAQLAVGGIVVGLAPLSLTQLMPGRYQIVASSPGFLPASGEVDVSRGQEATLQLSLEEEPSASSWPIWVGVGAAVLAAGGATAAALLVTQRDDAPPSFCTAPGGRGC